MLSPSSGSSEYWYGLGNNRTQRTQGLPGQELTTTYAYDKADRLTAAGAAAVTTSENGNLMRRLSGSVDETFTYDQADRVVNATIVEGGTPVTTSYAYDGDGRRVSKASGATARYVHDLARALPTLLDDGTRSFVWGAPLSNLGLVYAVDRSGNALIHHANGRGPVVALTDGTKAVVQTYITDEFGVPTVFQGTVGTSQPFLFAGEVYDDETNLLHLRARYYQPELGRFLQRDPLPGRPAAPASLNRYVYAGNNPATWVDRTGLDADGDPLTSDPDDAADPTTPVDSIGGGGAFGVAPAGARPPGAGAPSRAR